MAIEYRSSQEFTAGELKELFLSVAWSSGHYPDKLAVAMKHSGCVFSAWDGGKLVGLINALDDHAMTAYIHYLLVHPDYQGGGIGKKLVQMMCERYKGYLRIVLVAYDSEIDFYQKCGFEKGQGTSPMFITSLWT